MARVLKARYFRYSSFLQAVVGANPTYMWRSILSAQELLRAGCRWSVGKGASVRIWGDNWLLDDVNPCVTTPVIPDWEDKRVADLIEGREWKAGLIQSIFNDRDAKLIMAIPLPYNNRPDTLSWRHENRGQYTVRSGYGILRSRRTVNEADDNDVWQKLWKVQAPPKILNLLWRAAQNCLPSRYNLNYRHMSEIVTCPMCNREGETILHALVSCVSARGISNLSVVGLILGNAQSFKEWLKLVFTFLPAEKWGKCFAICWGLWWRRNDWLWNKNLRNESQVVSSSLHFPFMGVREMLSWIRERRRARVVLETDCLRVI